MNYDQKEYLKFLAVLLLAGVYSLVLVSCMLMGLTNTDTYLSNGVFILCLSLPLAVIFFTLGDK